MYIPFVFLMSYILAMLDENVIITKLGWQIRNKVQSGFVAVSCNVGTGFLSLFVF